MVTVRARRFLFASPSAVWRAMRSISPRICSRSTRSFSYVVSSESDLRRWSGSTGRGSSPRERDFNQPARLPTARCSRSSSAARTSSSRAMPIARSFFAVPGPTPASASTGSSRTNSSPVRAPIPVSPPGFFDVVEAEFPVLVRLVDTREEALALLLLRKMEEELEDARSVAMQVVFQPGDRAKPLLPDRVRVEEIVGQLFGAQDLRMHAHDQHLLVIRTVEDADATALGQETRGAPEKIMLQLLGARVLEAEHLAALGIDAGHHVLDDAVLAGRVHRLEDEQKGMPVGRVEQALQRAQLLNLLGEALPVLLLRRVIGLHARRPFLELELLVGADAEIVGVDLHRDGHGSSAGGAGGPLLQDNAGHSK